MDKLRKFYCTMFKPNTILIFKEKHGNRYFHVNSVDDAGKVCRKILKERHGIYWKNKISSFNISKPIISYEEAISLPECDIKNTVLNEYEKYNKLKIQYEKDVLFSKQVEDVINNNDNYSIELIFSRKDYEYEDVEIEYFEFV